jgi:hypothetical protein
LFPADLTQEWDGFREGELFTGETLDEAAAADLAA